MTRHILILGATSGIATAVCHELAKRGDRLALAGRNDDELQRLAQDLAIRHRVAVEVVRFEATELENHADTWRLARERLDDRIDGVVMSHGFMADDAETRRDPALIRRTVDVNLTSAISILEIIARDFEERGSGWIAAVSSVAGDRGRQSNYVYGSTKAGLSTYLQGLRNRLYRSGVHVLTVKPGFVYTALTQHQLDPSSPLVAAPERVARDIVRAVERRRNVLYTPWFWWTIMTVISAIPEPLFKRLKL